MAAHERDGQEALVAGAEVDDAAVERPVAGGADLGVVAAEELGGGERGEHELAVEAEQVEGAAPLVGVERPEGAPALGVEQAVLEGGAGGLVPGAGGGVLDRPGGELPRGAELQVAHPAPELVVDVAVEPVGQLHDVAVRVVVRAALGVGHRALLLRRSDRPGATECNSGTRRRLWHHAPASSLHKVTTCDGRGQ
jgi:hypothetical protein